MKLEQLDVFESPFSNKCKTVSWLRSSDLAKKKLQTWRKAEAKKEYNYIHT